MVVGAQSILLGYPSSLDAQSGELCASDFTSFLPQLGTISWDVVTCIPDGSSLFS